MIALILIDQQKGIDHPKLGNRNNPEAEAQMLTLLAHWRAIKWPVFHIMHRSSEPESVFWPHQDGFELKPEFQPQAGEYLLEKSVPCAFTNNSLGNELKNLGLERIAIAGVATNNSVESTARTAGNLGLNAFVVEDACFTFEQADYFGVHRSAGDVHAMSLANLDGEYARVVATTELLSLATA